MIQREYAPFIHSSKNAPFIYLNLIVAMLPCVCFSFISYGLRALVLVAFSGFAFFVSDYFMARVFRGKSAKKDYYDLSSICSGMIFALLLPPNTSIVIAIIGVLFGSVVVKQMFGGVGANLINPAIAARLFVSIVFSSELDGFAKPITSWFKIGSLITGASASSTIEQADATQLYVLEIIAGQFASYIGIGCAVVILIGLIFLLAKGIIKIYSPLAYLLSLALLYPVFSKINVFTYIGFRTFVYFMLTSGVLFVATFVLSDYTTTPINHKSAIISGCICGVMTAFMVGRFDSMVALCVPVLIANLTTPFLDYCSKKSFRKEGDAL